MPVFFGFAFVINCFHSFYTSV